MARRSNWGRKIAAGEFVTTIEITPPKGANPDKMVESVAGITPLRRWDEALADYLERAGLLAAAPV